MDRNAHPTENQRKYLADLIAVNLKDVINPPRTRGEMSDLITRVESNRYSAVVRTEVRRQVAPSPEVSGPLSGLNESNVAIGRTQKDLRKGVGASERARFAARFGIQNASADPLDWPFWALMAACAEFKVPPRLGTNYPYLGMSMEAATAESAPPMPPAFVAEAGVFYTEARLAAQGADGDDSAGSVAVSSGLNAAEVKAMIEAAVSAKVAEIEAANRITVEINGERREIEGVKHQLFEDVVTLAGARKPVMMIGPTGCGKSYLSEQVAQALGLPFYSINCTMGMSESKLLGLLLPDGRYVETDFVRAFERGGVFLLDEIDAADPNVLLIMNTAIASGTLPLPTRMDNPTARKHADFVLIAAANTHGTGANRMFVGRNQLDDATLDRFRVGQITLDYDRELEQRLIEDRDWLMEVWKIRDRVATAKLRRSISTRFAVDGADMIKLGWTKDKVIARLAEGWSDDERSKAGVK